MTAASLTVDDSAGQVTKGAAGDAAAGDSPAFAAASRLGELKRDRDALRKQVSRLREARAELEAPGIELQSLEDEARRLELQTAEAVADWVSRGCEGVRPVSDPSARLT
jgi:hypothetical protein